MKKASPLNFDASVCITKLVPFASVIFHCLILSFLPTKEVPVFTDCLNTISAWYEQAYLVVVFVVVVNTLAVDEQAELLRQLRTSDLSILLIPKQWFEGEKGDSAISK